MITLREFGIYAPARPAPDEDALTMAITAARSLPGAYTRTLAGVGRLAVASPALPYTRRVQSGLIAAALGLPSCTFCLECTTSERAASEALLALGEGLVIAADEHGAAAVLLDADAKAPLAVVESYASALAEWPGLEFAERGAIGIRDIQTPDYAHAAYLDVTLAAVRELCGPGRMVAPALAVVSAPNPRLALAVAGAAGAPKVRQAPPGVAGALIGLAAALDEVRPGERVLLVTYGAGSAADALLVRKER